MIGHAVRLGVRRGLIEFRHMLREPQEVGFTLVFTIGFLVVLFFQRDSVVAGLSLATLTLPSLAGAAVSFNATLGAVGVLSVEREDGTLLRAKSAPNGMVGYLVAKVVAISLSVLSSSVLIVVPGLVIVPALSSVSLLGWLALLGLLILGLLATLPWGAVIGSMANSPQGAAGLSMLLVGGLSAISGIFYPITAMPGWLQAIAQIFPTYWLGLGARAALLPDAAAAAELTGSWRIPWVLVVLGSWAVVGFLIAPAVLRRMARRESGSVMQARRERAMQRVG